MEPIVYVHHRRTPPYGRPLLLSLVCPLSWIGVVAGGGSAWYPAYVLLNPMLPSFVRVFVACNLVVFAILCSRSGQLSDHPPESFPQPGTPGCVLN